MKTWNKSLRVAVLGISLTWLCLGTVSAQTEIAVSGRASPGGGTFDRILRISAKGRHLAYVATLNASSESALFLFDGVRSARLASSDGAAPQYLGAFRTFGSIAVNSLGSVAFFAQVDGAGKGLFLWDERRGLSRIVLQGEVVENLEIVDFLDLNIGDSGRIAFSAFVSGDSGPAALLVFDDRGLRLLTVSGDSVDGERIELPRDLRFSEKEDVYFVNYEKVGPLSQYAPAVLMAADGDGGLRRVVGGGDRATNTDDAIHFGAGGRGIRSYDVDRAGVVYLIVDTASSEAIDSGEAERLSLFRYAPETDLVEETEALASPSRLRQVSATREFVLLGAETWPPSGPTRHSLLRFQPNGPLAGVQVPAAQGRLELAQLAGGDDHFFVLTRGGSRQGPTDFIIQYNADAQPSGRRP